MDNRSVLERLSEAKTSTDLSHRPTRCDVDYVAALGAAGIKHPAGSAILDADLTRDPDTLKVEASIPRIKPATILLVEDDERLAELKGQNEIAGAMFKMKNDPRVTKIGKFIRKHSIDEFPQFVNVFLGQMSLIGPRPGLPREVALYSEHDMKRLAVKPGCGGPWQVMGRSYLGFNEMVELDLDYIENRSLRQDLRLIFGTLKTMFSGEGAV